MKINNFGSTQGINPYKKQLNKIDKMAEVTAKQGIDKVEISQAAQELQQISPIELQRQERVEELKAQVEKGAYTIDPQQIAKSIINYYSKI